MAAAQPPPPMVIPLHIWHLATSSPLWPFAVSRDHNHNGFLLVSDIYFRFPAKNWPIANNVFA